MAILGVPSTSIVDSTSVGRSLITASDAAAARVIMELSALDSPTFAGLTTSTLSGDGASVLYVDQPIAGSSVRFRYGGVQYVFMDRAVLRPSNNNANLLGNASYRWASVYSVDGSFSGNLDTEVGGSNRIFNLGSDADVAAGDTEYLETSFDTNVATISSKATGTGVQRNIAIDAPVFTMAANVDFTGLPTSDPVVAGRLWNHNDTVKISAG